jgi:hypothetical protein
MVRGLVPSACALLTLMGCTEKVDKPDPPDLTELDRAYRTPTGTFDAQTAPAVFAALDDKVASLSDVCGFQSASELFCKSGSEGCTVCAGLEPVLDLLRTLAGESEGKPPAAVNDAVEGDGYLRVTRICPGHLTKPSPDPAHGTIQLTVGFSESGLDAVPFGHMAGCQMDIGGAHNTFDADLALSFGRSFRLSMLGELAAVVQLSGDVDTALGRADLDTDMQIAPVNELGFALLLYPEGTRELLFVQSADGAGFRAHNGTFLCSESVCTNEQGEQVEVSR